MSGERTALSPDEERAFMAWVAANGIHDLDHPDSHYDYRGYWKALASQGQDPRQINAQDGQLHYPDTYKQHGHPSFSVESQYSRGLQDGGQWIGDTLIAPPMPSHQRTTGMLGDLIRALAMQQRGR